MNRHFLETPFGQIHYLDVGEKTNPPVLLLHKTPRSMDEFRDVIPILKPKYHVIAMDNLGYGDSDKPENVPNVSDFALTVKLLLDHLKIKKVNIAGHLTGGIIGIETAAAYPERVNKLVISGPIYIDEKTRREHTEIFKQYRIRADGMYMIDLWNERVPYYPDPQFLHRFMVDVLKPGEKSQYGHFAINKYHMEDRLPLVKCPVLLIYGDKDPWIYPEKYEIFDKILPWVKKAFVPNGGMFLPDEMPEIFARHVMEFLEEKGK